ncbi:hypothetical protein TELCIR_02103 [Teladorsagia circumcincta]|uniref:Thiolase N-terminal domain-containing protein n=1 Tax=Teladorsagia circumcincta TaxID=45464 RepID=A0A2G9V0B1_TELCI|nr:hypothetical protein TELCIR_02103 [Teladorsagia circumcincta]
MLSIKSGYRKKILVAGCENMSQVPFYLPRGEIPYGGLKIVDGIAKDGLQDFMLNVPMGLCAEKSVKAHLGPDYKNKPKKIIIHYAKIH